MYHLRRILEPWPGTPSFLCSTCEEFVTEDIEWPAQGPLQNNL